MATLFKGAEVNAGLNARIMKNVEELKAKYGSDLVKDIAILPDSSITGSNTLIKAKACALEADFTEIPT